MSNFIAAVALVWVVGGLYLIMNSRSRGFWADALFMLIWPIHFVRHLMGLE